MAIPHLISSEHEYPYNARGEFGPWPQINSDGSTAALWCVLQKQAATPGHDVDILKSTDGGDTWSVEVTMPMQAVYTNDTAPSAQVLGGFGAFMDRKNLLLAPSASQYIWVAVVTYDGTYYPQTYYLYGYDTGSATFVSAGKAPDLCCWNGPNVTDHYVASTPYPDTCNVSRIFVVSRYDIAGGTHKARVLSNIVPFADPILETFWDRVGYTEFIVGSGWQGAFGSTAAAHFDVKYGNYNFAGPGPIYEYVPYRPGLGQPFYPGYLDTLDGFAFDDVPATAGEGDLFYATRVTSQGQWLLVEPSSPRPVTPAIRFPLNAELWPIPQASPFGLLSPQSAGVTESTAFSLNSVNHAQAMLLLGTTTSDVFGPGADAANNASNLTLCAASPSGFTFEYKLVGIGAAVHVNMNPDPSRARSLQPSALVFNTVGTVCPGDESPAYYWMVFWTHCTPTVGNADNSIYGIVSFLGSAEDHEYASAVTVYSTETTDTIKNVNATTVSKAGNTLPFEVNLMYDRWGAADAHSVYYLRYTPTMPGCPPCPPPVSSGGYFMVVGRA